MYIVHCYLKLREGNPPHMFHGAGIFTYKTKKKICVTVGTYSSTTEHLAWGWFIIIGITRYYRITTT